MPDFFVLALVRGSPRTRANQKKWRIFKCPFRGILLRHQHDDASEATGNVSPTIPKPQKKNKCGVFGQILLAAVAIAVTVLALPSGGTSVGIGQGILAGLAGGAASQAVGVATGIQSKFDFKGLALSAIGGGVSAGVGQVLGQGALAGSQLAGDVARGVLTSAMTQGIGVATGLQSKFNWANVAAAGVMSGVGGAVMRGMSASQGQYENGSWQWNDGASPSFGAQAAAGAVSVMAGAATRSAITGSSFGDSAVALLPDAVGQVVGRALGSAADKAIANASQTSQQANYKPVAERSSTVGNNASEIIVTARPNLGGYRYGYSYLSPETRIATASIDGTITPEEAKAASDNVRQIKQKLYKDTFGRDHGETSPLQPEPDTRYHDGKIMEVRMADPIDLGTLFAQKQLYMAAYDAGKGVYSPQQHADIMAAYDSREALIRQWDAQANSQIDRFFGGFLLSGVAGGATLAVGGGVVAYFGLEGGSAFLANSAVGGFTAANQNGTFVSVNGGEYSFGDYGRDFAIGTVATGGFMGISAFGGRLSTRFVGNVSVAPELSAYNVSTANMSTAERQAVIEYAQRTNVWLAENGGTTVQSTAGTLRSQANAAARTERLNAARAGTPYSGQAGHVPDTALTGTAQPPAGWLDMPGKSNSVVGVGLSSRIGQRVDVITVDGLIP